MSDAKAVWASAWLSGRPVGPYIYPPPLRRLSPSRLYLYGRRRRTSSLKKHLILRQRALSGFAIAVH